MFTVCVGLVFRSKYLQFPIICSLQYSININTVEVDPHSDLLHICIVKRKNCFTSVGCWVVGLLEDYYSIASLPLGVGRLVCFDYRAVGLFY